MTNLMTRRITQTLTNLRQAFRTPYFGFVRGHTYLNKVEWQQIEKLVGRSQDGLIEEFERNFAHLIGEGRCIAYAAGRMGFFELMRQLEIGHGDEVILPGATCAVMVNAVRRIGATPVYADIDPDTFGSSCQDIGNRITPRTRMIVAQHSFGIPCQIESIAELARSKNIFLLEDCALTLGSSVNGVAVGNFSDAALFSTDHSKPINTLIGGLVYTSDNDLAEALKHRQTSYAELSANRQNALWNRLQLEAKYCKPSCYGKMSVIEMISSIKKKYFDAENDFLEDDNKDLNSINYPYPGKLPVFLALVGIYEIRRWQEVSDTRIALLTEFISALEQYEMGKYLPAAYRDKALKIVPLRLAWSQPGGEAVRRSIRHFVHVSWTWFMKPIVSSKFPLSEFGYETGCCPISEAVGPNMVNLPCNISREEAGNLISRIQNLGL